MYVYVPGVVEVSVPCHGDHGAKTILRQSNGKTVTLFSKCLLPHGQEVTLRCSVALVKGSRAACFRILEI